MLIHSNQLNEELEQGNEAAYCQSAGNHPVALLGSRTVVHVLDVLGFDIRHVDVLAGMVQMVTFSHSVLAHALLLPQGRWVWSLLGG